MRIRKTLACMLAAFFLFAVGCSKADTQDHRTVAMELAEITLPEEAFVVAATNGARLAIKGHFDKNSRTRPYAAVLEEVALEASEAMFRDPETIERFRKMALDIIMETYTESEIREIVKFYRSPVGKKAVAVMPEVIRKGMERGAAIGQSLGDSPKFEKMLADKVAQFKAEGKLPENF